MIDEILLRQILHVVKAKAGLSWKPFSWVETADLSFVHDKNQLRMSRELIERVDYLLAT